MNYYQFDCGCKLPIKDEKIKEYDGLPSLDIDFYNIDHNCPATWDLISSGKTKGIFQLESYLGSGWAAKLKPDSINQLSALISIIRPGVLKSILDGKSLTQHYVDRRHGLEEVSVIHPSLLDIVEDTYGVLCYQEQAIKIANKIAGFTPEEADTLRKAIGKKKPEIMTKAMNQLIEGCKKQAIVNDEQSEQIAAWIRESQKYSFNKSHGVGYAEVGYWSAWMKQHFPLHFYTGWLKYAHEKIKPHQEISELVYDAKIRGISINLPDLKHKDISLRNKQVYFGTNDVKGVGDNHSIQLAKNIIEKENELGRPVTQWSWLEILFYLSEKVNKTVFNNLVCLGCMSFTKMTRQRMIYEYNVFTKLTDREKSLAVLDGSLSDVLKSIINSGKLQDKRSFILLDLIKVLDNPTYSTNDGVDWIIQKERELIGCPISYSIFDNTDTSIVNTTCKEFDDGKTEKNMIFGVEIFSLREYVLPNGNLAGQTQLYLTVKDETGTMRCVAFPDAYKKYKHLLYQDNLVILIGNRSKRGDNLTVNRVLQL